MNEIALCDGAIAGLHRAGGSARALALHGWLDNANSFRALSESLDGIDLIAIDFPGHGHSRPRPKGAHYHFDDYVFDVIAVLDDLDWPQCHLIGHSLGGAVASVVAAAAPKRVRSLSLIEGLGPLSLPADRTAQGWRRALERSRDRPRRVHGDRTSAIAARTENSDLDHVRAAVLAERGLIEHSGGWQWRHDLRLTWPSVHRYTETQVVDLIGAIEAPVLNIHSDPPSEIAELRLIRRRLAALSDASVMACPGGHHLHMRHPERVGSAITQHIKRHE